MEGGFLDHSLRPRRSGIWLETSDQDETAVETPTAPRAYIRVHCLEATVPMSVNLQCKRAGAAAFSSSSLPKSQPHSVVLFPSLYCACWCLL